MPFYPKKHAIVATILLWVLLVVACNYPGHVSQALLTPVVTSTPTLPSPTSPPATLDSDPTVHPSPTPFLEPTPEPTATPLATIEYQPVFEPAACQFSLPAGYQPDCGYLLVPEDRQQAGGRMLRLHVAIFRSGNQDEDATPAIHLSGGPGSPSLATTGYIFSRGASAILEQRDYVFFDQRGTGYSRPSLYCPEVIDQQAEILDANPPDNEATQQILQAYLSCRDRLLNERIDLSDYNSAASAADVNDLRIALRYDQVNLIGVSYGTRLALTVMRDFPHILRSVVLDSPYPPQVNLYTSLSQNAGRAFEVLFAGCAQDPDCNGAYPDLRSAFYRLVDQLNADPIRVSTSDPASGASYQVTVDGDLLIDVLFLGLYNRDVIATMPKMIFDIQRGDYAILSQRLSLYFSRSTAIGMQVSVQCSEEFPFGTLQQAIEVAQSVQPQIAAVYPASLEPYYLLCDQWGAGEPEPIENLPVSSSIPTLILSGEYDPITPPQWGYLAAENLSQSYVYEFPGVGHWVLRSGSCGLQIVRAFLEQPEAPPEASCLASLGGPQFSR